MGNAFLAQCDGCDVALATRRSPVSKRSAFDRVGALAALEEQPMEISSLSDLEGNHVDKWSFYTMSHAMMNHSVLDGVAEVWDMKQQQLGILTGNHYSSSTSAIEMPVHAV
uniref:Uncharacterized protein n=1 Tax=Noctiluca scintillans TaxID=2966 RepID=A0A7S1FBB9_NOCSC|eukprot:CAMPEP_0194542130 /NCGR_PEP_ID=MMETSP0253-20130528/83484_1 /TAXON_ID=2966 /ORGANISM="Noctiluca scintillans" /LENGTH=110 /DNA_ID=CAMNT_0039388715 /DNA_START=16 /DNA_END=348 /DNA_ORIENTATION=-